MGIWRGSADLKRKERERKGCGRKAVEKKRGEEERRREKEIKK